jgi:ABC-type bacteriocin/lantibiotic exporter with double-glycine peptidase domain
MTSFLQLVGQIQHPILTLLGMVPQLVHSTASIDRLDELEKSAFEQGGLKHSSRLMSGCLGLRLEKVNFGYIGCDCEFIRDFTYDFVPGSRSAIMGETGKGKTTLFRLLLGFVKPDDGRMLIYSETEVSSVTDATRSNFVYVPQGNTLMNGSVRYNLQLANPEASEKEMIDALHVACADFVDALPDGIDTEIGERGHGLSEGQAQRIAIARGLLRPGNILLFDEISSSLDEVTEAELYRRLFEAFPQKTMIFVTHRTAVCELCDSVIRM